MPDATPTPARAAVPVGLLSITAGAAVANLYYCQPLLPQIGRTFGLANGRVSLVSTAAQVGYALGLLVFVPLGDVLERRRLMVTPLVGRLADRSSPRDTVGIGLAVLALSYLLFLLFGHTIAGLVAGVILVDAGMQVVGVSNQARIYRLAEAAHSRLNTVYMVAYFAGGSVGSALGVWAWGRWRWTGVCVVALAAVALAIALYARGRRRLAA